MKLFHLYDRDMPLRQGVSFFFQKYKPQDKLYLELLLGFRIKNQSVSIRLSKGWKSWIYYTNFRDKEWYFPNHETYTRDSLTDLGNTLMSVAFKRNNNANH